MKAIACALVAASLLFNVSCSTSSAPSGDYAFSAEPIQSKTGVVVRRR